MSSIKNRQRLLDILMIILLVLAILGVIIDLRLYPSIPISGPTTKETTTPKRTVEDVIREIISTVDPEVRESAIDILYSYTNRSFIVLQASKSIGPGDWDYVAFDYAYPFVYELSVSVSGSCVGTCNIDVELLDSEFKIIKYIGRVSSLRRNLTELWYYDSMTVGKFYLKLDNGFSILTSKTVYVTIRAYLLSDYVLNDVMFKIITIGEWVSLNIKYISDPYKIEYITNPKETLKVKAGDCDDFAVLLASLYRAVGLRTAVALIDTDKSGTVDHATALVALEKTELSKFKNSLSKYSILFGRKFTGCVSYFDRGDYIWLIIDPPMSDKIYEPWCVTYNPYDLLRLIEPG